MINNLSYYEKHYNDILSNIFNNYLKENSHTLFILEKSFNPLDNYSFIIKKKNLFLSLLIEDEYICNNILNSIKGENCESNINIFKNINEINRKKFNNIVLFHINSIDYMNDILNKLKIYLSNSFNVYMYATLCNSKKNINYKNMIRRNIIEYLNYNIGYVLQYDLFLESIYKNKNVKLVSLKILNNNVYFLYGNNTTYEIIMTENN